MTLIAYTIEANGPPRMLTIGIRLAERNGALLSILDESCSAQKIKEFASLKDREILAFLAKHQTMATHPMVFSLPGTKSLETLKLLAASGKLCFQKRQLACDFFGVNTCYFNIGVDLAVEGRLKGNGWDISVKECDLIGAGPPHWFIKGISLRLIETKISWNDLQECLKDKPQFSRDQLQELMEDEDGPKLCFKDGSDIVLKMQQDPLPLLKLNDRHGSFADLWMDYGNGQQLPFQASFHTPSTIKRRIDAEKQWEKDLLETDFIKKAVGGSNYYCPLDKVPRSLAFLLELGWRIVDHQGHRVINQSKKAFAMEDDNAYIRLKGKIFFDNFEANLSDIAGAFNKRESFVQLSPGVVGLLQSSEAPLWKGLLEDGEIVQDSLRLKKNQLGAFADLLESRELSIPFDLTPIRDSLRSLQEIPQVESGSRFCGKLRHYQSLGLSWLHFLYTYHFHGILADDMGLGKTVQVLAFLSTLKQTSPTLIVMPTSLIFNWRQEIEKFLPGSKALVYHGNNRVKNIDILKQSEIILTTYSTLRQDVDFLASIEYGCVIVDEAQVIKNAQTQIARCLCRLASRFRLSITGTPIENSLSEIWSQFRFLMPDLLGDQASFNSELQAAESDSRYLDRLKKKIRPFILRRKKEEVAKELPERIEQTIWVEMEEAQRQVYEEFLAGVKNNVLKKVSADGLAAHRIAVFEAILRLRQICCHPLLIPSIPPSIGFENSAKLQALMQDLGTFIAEGQKVLVYSQFTSMLALLSKACKEQQWSFVTLDGSTTNREEVVKQFQTDPSISIFLISLKAGGVGLNLTAADAVVVYDPWWNEAVEEQAISRTHRIGRTSHVIAKRFVIRESIEEKMMSLKASKRSLVANILDEGDMQGKLSEEDFLYLLS